MTKIVCFSDIHDQYKSKNLTKWFQDNPADILLFAGDIQGEYNGEDFPEWINGLPYKHKLLVFGNHDGNSRDILEQAKKYPGIRFINQEGVCVEGIHIYGSPYSVTFGNWWFMENEWKLAELYQEIPDRTEILLTHTPAFGILDQTFYGEMVGSKSLLSRIRELPNLKYHVFGHVHEGAGKSNGGKVTFVNASVLDEKYRLVRMPTIIEYN
jgi:Icc-related predicted phosphoesterase